MKTSIQTRLVAVAAVFLVAVFSGGCSKSPSPRTTHNLHGLVVAMPTNITYLGVVELSDQIATRLDIGSGKSCVLTPTALSLGNLKIDVVLEQTDAHGKLATFSPSPVSTHDGERFGVSVGDICFALTPKLKVK